MLLFVFKYYLLILGIIWQVYSNLKIKEGGYSLVKFCTFYFYKRTSQKLPSKFLEIVLLYAVIICGWINREIAWRIGNLANY